ncbi:MAG: YdcH family protein [Azospirillaceae bacterium]
MSMADRITSLRSRHADLEARLHEELNRPFPDHDAIGRLKREKLKLKDELARLTVPAGTAA